MFIQEKPIKTLQAILLILFVLITTLSFLPSPGTFDMNDWQQWAKNADTLGLVPGFKANQENYPPLSTVILVSSLKISRWFGVGVFDSVKLAIFFCLCLTSLAFWLWTKDIMLVTLLHLSLLLNSMALGYIDILFAPSLIFALWALKKRKLVLFSMLYAFACLTKWQPLLIAPFLVLYILKITHVTHWKQIQFKQVLQQVLLPVAAVLVGIFSIFGVEEVSQSLIRVTSMHPYLSGNALNLNWVITHFLHIFDPARFGGLKNGEAEFIINTSPKLTTLPRLLFLLFYASALIVFFKREKTFENVILFSLLGYLAYFMFNTGVHENHLFLAGLLAVILFWLNKKYTTPMVILLLMSNLNLFLFYGIDGTGLPFGRALGGVLDVALLVSIFNVCFFLFLWATALLTRGKPSAQTTPQAVTH